MHFISLIILGHSPCGEIIPVAEVAKNPAIFQPQSQILRSFCYFVNLVHFCEVRFLLYQGIEYFVYSLVQPMA